MGSGPLSRKNPAPSQLYFPVMQSDDALDARTRRLYVWAIVCEAVVIAALWAFTRAFS